MRQLRVRDMMTSSVITLREDDDLSKASITLAVNGISGAPVVDEREHMIGILSSMDILNFIKCYRDRRQLDHPTLVLLTVPLDEDIEDQELKKAYAEISRTRVGDIMTEEVYYVHPQDPVMTALDIMMEHRVRRLPVLEKERVVGIITRKDIIWGIFKGKT